MTIADITAPSTTPVMPDYMHPESHQKFSQDIANHQMTVKRDDGLYRHLSFTNPDCSWMHWFEIVTWPGALTIRGDMGTFTFARIEDMFKFFTSNGYINPGYWAEKIDRNARGSATGFDDEKAIKFVNEAWEQVADRYSDEDQEDIRQSIESDLIDVAQMGDEAYFRAELESFTCKGFYFDGDQHHADFTNWDSHYLWCCHAILWGIGKYQSL